MWEFGELRGCILQWDVAGGGEWSPGESSVEGGREPVSPVTGQGADLHREYFDSTRSNLALEAWAQSFPGQGGLAQCWWEQRESLSEIVREAEELPGQLAQACSPQHVPGLQWDSNQPGFINTLIFGGFGSVQRAACQPSLCGKWGVQGGTSLAMAMPHFGSCSSFFLGD